MRNAVIAFFLILAVIVITKPRGEEPPSRASGMSPLSCTASPQRVTVSDGRLTAAARFQCGSPGPDRLALIIRLQRSADGGWSTVAEQAFTAAGGETLRTVPAEQRTRQVSAPCQDGVFRTQAAWSINDGRPYSWLSAERRTSCG